MSAQLMQRCSTENERMVYLPGCSSEEETCRTVLSRCALSGARELCTMMGLWPWMELW